MNGPEGVVDAARAVWSEVDLDAIRANVAALREVAAPAALLAVVKANGYGHGAVPVARAALDAGASWLGVARVEEGEQLREAGHRRADHAAVGARAARGRPASWRRGSPRSCTPTPGSTRWPRPWPTPGGGAPLEVHLKVDTGMHRVGCAPDDALALAARSPRATSCRWRACAPTWRSPTSPTTPTPPSSSRGSTRCSTSSTPSRPAPAARARGEFRRAARSPARATTSCASASPATACRPRRPWPTPIVALRPALSLRARVTFVKSLPTGAAVSYGLRSEVGTSGRVATVPAGYADGVPRSLGMVGGEVLIRGRRRPIIGMVTMDQLLVDLGDVPAEPDDDVVLIGRQGDDEITATEWGERLGTISYEVVTGIGARVPRTYLGDPGGAGGVGGTEGTEAHRADRGGHRRRDRSRVRDRACAGGAPAPPRRSRRRRAAGPRVRRGAHPRQPRRRHHLHHSPG